MTNRDIKSALVDIIQYNYFWPGAESEDAVYGFTHSQEVNDICRDIPPPHAVTPVEKVVLEDALADYLQRNGTSAADEAIIRAWLSRMPDEVAIIERKP